ncbi:MAG TPA: nuclear transport factor 2 family protein [Thermoanaerobaculia bacterium]|nr:nuclear transport factor 2 family protein [Thermoanaerobaculia bacterium]
MKKAVLLWAALLGWAAVGLTQGYDLQPTLDSLVQAEVAFSRWSVEKGMREAFLAFLADDGILFRPGPVAGKEWWQAIKTPPSPVFLIWRPVQAQVARSGELGWTTGPWELRKNGTGEVSSHGQFISVWKRRADGPWRVVIDAGISHPYPAASVPRVDGPAAAFQVKTYAGDGAPNLASLMESDRELSRASLAQGTAAAYTERLAEEPRFYRDGSQPSLGRDAVRAALAASSERWSWQPLGGDVSKAGDLGYTYGTFQVEKGSEPGYYLRIWSRQGGAWRIAVDVATVMPTPAPASQPAGGV